MKNEDIDTINKKLVDRESCRELKKEFMKRLTKHILKDHVDALVRANIGDWGEIHVPATCTGRELSFPSNICRMLQKCNIIEFYADTAGLDSIALKNETREIMTKKVNDKLRRLGFKELRCRI